MPLVENRLKEMSIDLGDIIGEPIALMCYHKTTKWSGVIKLHLKNPEFDGVGLLQGLRPFILKLDEEKNKRGKICKTYDSLALNNLLSVKITSEGLASKEWFEMFEKLSMRVSQGARNTRLRISKKRTKTYLHGLWHLHRSKLNG
jgi:hypothetical protein